MSDENKKEEETKVDKPAESKAEAPKAAAPKKAVPKAAPKAEPKAEPAAPKTDNKLTEEEKTKVLNLVEHCAIVPAKATDTTGFGDEQIKKVGKHVDFWQNVKDKLEAIL